jgi:hypothetical protein
MHSGYASVALVPIRNQDRIVGLIHLNHRRKGRFTLDTVELLEGIASHIGEALTRKRVEEDLRKRNVFIETLLENAPIGFAVNTIAEGRPVFISRTFANIYGVAPDSITSVADYFEKVYLDPTFRAKIRERIMADMASGDAARMRWDDIAFTTQAGERRVVTAMNIPLPEQNLMISTVQDVTARKTLESQFHHAQKMESIGRLAGGVAHDFNNLLTVINGYSQMLLAKLSVGDPLRDDLSEIHNAGERAAGLTRQLLAFSRKQVLQPRKLDVNRVVEDMRPMLVRLVGEDVEVRIALQADVGTIHADPHQLEQVVMNLVVNARDAMPGVGKLLVETANIERDESYTRSHPEARVGRYVMLAVSDTGVGMDEETKSRIFEPFFTTKGVGKGTGLGLSMVQGIVAQSGGYVEVYSEPGKGTTFKIYLPAAAEAATDTGRAPAVPAQGKETVLVVEDQAEVRKFAVAVLKSYGHRVISAESAGDALLFCERERIDLVLTDVVMPNVSGRELAGRLEALRPGIKVLSMSGYTDNVIEHHGVLEQGARFIQKPFSPEELAGRVRGVLGPPAPAVAPAARILVADDEGGVRGFLRKVLEEGGHEVIEAVDGKQALQQVLAGRVDLVITDLIMPDQEGIETIQALRRQAPGVGIIAISGAFGGQFLKTAKMLGAAAVLNKPVSAELLLANVADVLKSRR